MHIRPVTTLSALPECRCGGVVNNKNACFVCSKTELGGDPVTNHVTGRVSHRWQQDKALQAVVATAKMRLVSHLDNTA